MESMREYHRGTETQSSKLTQTVIGAAIEVHRELGPGLLESIYEQCLAEELRQLGLAYEKQKPIPLKYKGKSLDQELRIDLYVESQLIVEVKSVEQLLPVHEAQLLTYMKLTDSRIGLLINFNEALLKNGLKRMVL